MCFLWCFMRSLGIILGGFSNGLRFKHFFTVLTSSEKHKKNLLKFYTNHNFSWLKNIVRLIELFLKPSTHFFEIWNISLSLKLGWPFFFIWGLLLRVYTSHKKGVFSSLQAFVFYRKNLKQVFFYCRGLKSIFFVHPSDSDLLFGFFSIPKFRFLLASRKKKSIFFRFRIIL